MKLVSFSHAGADSYGIVEAGGVIDAGARAKGRHPSLAEALADPAHLAEFAGSSPDHALAEVTLLPPVPHSGRIICIGLNYKTHIAEGGRDAPKYPLLFPRYPDSLVGNGQPMIRPRASDQFDFEGELAFVIGKPGRHISREHALDHVAGYTCFNDGSMRDFQRHTTQFLPGKNFAASGACGPWIVTPDEVGPLDAQTIETRLNGQIVQQAGLDDLLFKVEDLIAYMSTIWTLQPGDLVATGTTGGVGAFRTPPLWMKPGDKIEVEISRIGILANPIAQED
jgi:2-keto-4-pentenoate hydratase/2-oxohepta-3-ene-1,7-dioic acid hydratase in catechol pathway